jgi:hypothetical protein
MTESRFDALFRGCFPPDPMKLNVMIRFLTLSSLLASMPLVSFAEPPPPGERGDRPDKPPRYMGPPPGERGDRERGDRDPRGGGGDRDRGPDWRGGGGGIPGFGGRPPKRNDGFDKLPEEDKKRVREALDKVWGRPEVIQAKDKAMRANEEMRDTVRESLKKIDPEAATILERMEPKDHFDPRQLPKLPPADSAEFPEVLVRRLGMELISFSRPDRREETRKLHERVMTLPSVKAAVAEVENSQGESRSQAAQKLRNIYREEVAKEFQAARVKRADEPKKD